MRISMQNAHRLTLAEMERFVAASGSLTFSGTGREEIYGFVERTLQSQQYLQLSKKDKGVVRRYLAKVSGRSRALITRLIRCYRRRGAVCTSFPSAFAVFTPTTARSSQRRVAGLLDKLLVHEFTKSRAHRTTDNALVEGKNGALVRKHIGHEPIAAEHAAQFERFCMAYFNSYLNFHHPCGFAQLERTDNGKRRHRYRLADYRTPYEKLVSLDDWQQHPKAGLSAARLEQQAQRMSDTEAARRLQAFKRKLLAQCRSRW